MSRIGRKRTFAGKSRDKIESELVSPAQTSRGGALSEKGIRQRLAAILAADAAGYSRLMAADEHGTVTVLDAARDIFKAQIESRQGRVVDMAGDSVLAVFETATGAVAAALAIQEELERQVSALPRGRRMRFRIGVHLGDVIEKADGTVYGDGVNIAARLQGLAVPGGITVSDSVRNAVRGKVSAAFNDLGEQTVKNIPEPVRAYSAEAEGGAAAKPRSVVREIDLSVPDKPSIAVLPFANMSGDPEQEYFSDGVTEDIITELSRFHSLFVIARNSTFTYKKKATDIRVVAKELGVRYVLEGSIRKSANRVRVTTQLVDALTGKHIWAERYDRMLEDIFAVQEEVTQSIVAAIAPQIAAAELAIARRSRPGSLSAYEVALKASANARVAWVTADRMLLDRAIKEAKEALATDPGSVLALNALAWSSWQTLFLKIATDAEAAWKAGMAAAGRAIELDRLDNQAYRWKGMLLLAAPGEVQWDDALANLRRAHELNPNDASTLQSLGYGEVVAGNPHQAIDHLTRFLRVSPRDPVIYNAYTVLAVAYFVTRDYDDSLRYALLAIREAPNSPGPYLSAVLAHVGIGDMNSAKAALETARGIAPQYVQSRLHGDIPWRKAEDRQRQMTFLRIAAGLEGPSAADAFR